MNKLFKKISALGFITLIFFCCETTYVPSSSSGDIEYPQGTTLAKVVLQIFDSHSNGILSGVKVTIIGKDSLESDATGIVTFPSVPVGTYLVSCKKTGYQPIISPLQISIDPNSTVVPIVNQSTSMLFMPKQGVALRGMIYYEEANVKRLAVGAKVECLFIVKDSASGKTDYLEPLRTTATLANGTFSLADLPEYTYMKISVLPYNIGNKIYKASAPQYFTTDAVGDTIISQSVVLAPVSGDNFVLLSSNLADFNTTDTIVLTFSEPIDTTLLTPDSITVSHNQGQVLVLKQWSVNNTILRIIPFDGIWSTQKTYILRIKKLLSTSGKILDNTNLNPFNFIPQVSGALGNIEDVRYRINLNDTTKADWNTNAIYLLWSGLVDAQRYDIYQKALDEPTWHRIATVTDTFDYVSTPEFFTNGQSAKFMILGVNNTSSSPISTATKLIVKDGKSPVVPSNLSSSYGFNNSSTTPDTLSINVSTSYLPEPMDTSLKPVVEVIEASYAEGAIMYGDSTYKVNTATCSWMWTSLRSGNLSVVVDPSSNGAYDTLKINFKNVTDLAGNKVDSTAGSFGYRTYRTRN